MPNYKIEMRIVDTHTDDIVVATSWPYEEEGDFLSQANELSRLFLRRKVEHENKHYPV